MEASDNPLFAGRLLCASFVMMKDDATLETVILVTIEYLPRVDDYSQIGTQIEGPEIEARLVPTSIGNVSPKRIIHRRRNANVQ